MEDLTIIIIQNRTIINFDHGNAKTKPPEIRRRWGRKMAHGLEGRAQEILSEVDEKGTKL